MSRVIFRSDFVISSEFCNFVDKKKRCVAEVMPARFFYATI